MSATVLSTKYRCQFGHWLAELDVTDQRIHSTGKICAALRVYVHLFGHKNRMSLVASNDLLTQSKTMLNLILYQVATTNRGVTDLCVQADIVELR